MEIQAYAGPMNREEAIIFRRRWKTPPRTNSQHNHSGADSPLSTSFGQLFSPSAGAAGRFTPAKMSSPATSTPFGSPRQAANINRQLFAHRPNGVASPAMVATPTTTPTDEDDDAAIEVDFERLASNSLTGLDVTDPPPGPTATAHALATPFRHYRQPTASMLDDSLQLLSASLASASGTPLNETAMYRERHAKLCDSEKGLEVIGRELARERHVKWREYWPFLDAFIDIRSADGLAAFEKRLIEVELARRREAVKAEKAAVEAERQSAKEAEALAAAQAAAKAVPPTRMAAMTAAAASLKETSISLLCKALSQLEVKGAFSAEGRLPTAPPVLQVQSQTPATPAGAAQPAATASAAVAIPLRRTIVQQTQSPAGEFSAYMYAERSWQVYAKRVIDTMRSAATATAGGVGTIKRDHLAGE